MHGVVREGQLGAVHASPTAGDLRDRTRRSFAITGSAALLFAFLGPLGTDAVGLAPRLLYWSAVFMTGSLMGLVCTYAVFAWSGLRSRPWAEALLVTTLIALPHSFVVVVASMLMFGRSIASPASVAEVGVIVWVLTLAMTAVHYATRRAALDAPPSPAAPPPLLPEPERPAPAPEGIPGAIADKLPTRLREGRLLALEAEDHYLRVHTDLGSDLVLMRMGDATALLDKVEGARTHRSWWVARAAVRAGRVENGRAVLELESGLEVPVSRNARPELQARGWL